MSKELGIMRDIKYRLKELGYDEAVLADCDLVINALQRLEQIDNANPSKALECVEDLIFNFSVDEYVERYDNNLKTIKQALLKQQESKHYLKWEDLEFKEEIQFIKVKLSGTEYILKYYVSILNEEMIEILWTDNFFITGLSHTCKNDKQFFNDLHLVRVEK